MAGTMAINRGTLIVASMRADARALCAIAACSFGATAHLLQHVHKPCGIPRGHAGVVTLRAIAGLREHTRIATGRHERIGGWRALPVYAPGIPLTWPAHYSQTPLNDRSMANRSRPHRFGPFTVRLRLSCTFSSITTGRGNPL